VTRAKLVALYAAFAALSIAVNIGSQALSMAVYAGPWAVTLSMAFGTGTGLVCKYVLDKRFVFAHQSRDRKHEAKTFILYTVMGLATTAIFWGTEAAFHVAFESDAMRYVGGVIGLCIGYVVKYRLDARFVFSQNTA
jgi:peptidoglycan biosynthesis protein MviN/MurJ (putative lipid II flippase)